MVPASFSALMLMVGIAIGYPIGRMAVTGMSKPRAGNVLIAVFAITLSIGSVWQGYVQNRNTERISDCNARYANELAVALNARFGAADTEREALTEWLRATHDALDNPAPGTGKIIRDALDSYLQARIDAQAQRQSTPYPEPPGQACPGVSP